MSNKLAIIEARSLPRIQDQQPTELYNPMVGIIGKVFLMAGQEINKEDLKALANAMANLLSRKFATLTMQEVNIAMEKGVMREYGKYYGLNMVSFNDWLNAYMDSGERAKAIEEQIKQKFIAAPKEPTTAEIDQMKNDAILYGFKLYQSNGECSRHANNIYKYLEDKKLINLSTSEKQELMLKANKVMDEEFVELKTRKKVSKQFGDILDTMLNPKYRTSNQVAMYAMRIAINNFYKHVADEGMDLEQLLKNNK